MADDVDVGAGDALPALSLEDLNLVDTQDGDGGQQQDGGANGGANGAQNGGDGGQQQQQQAPWFGEIGDDLKPVAEEFKDKTPADALKALLDARAAQKPADGDWRKSIADDKLRAVADRYGSPADMVKGLNDLRAEVSKRIKVPDENASDEDRAAFRKATGAGDKIESYKEALKVPEGIEVTEADQAVVDMALEIAVEEGVPVSSMNGLIGKFLAKNHELREAAIGQVKQFRVEKEAELRREWTGSDFDSNLALSKRAVDTLGEKLGVPELGAFLESTKIDDGGMLGDHPIFSKLFAGLGRRMGEGGMTIVTSEDEIQTVRDQINELNQKVPVGSKEYVSEPHQRKLQDLYGKLGDGPIIGSQGRAA